MSLKCFYTLPGSLEGDRIIWRIIPRLKDRIDKLCQIIRPVEYLVNDPLEAAIAQYLFQQLCQHPEDELIGTHWIAFLQRRCEIVAKRMLPFIGGHHQAIVGFQDLFMMASIAAIEPAKFFRNFDESRYQLGYWHYPTFIKFTDIKLKHLLLPELRRETGNNMYGQSNLGLVARSSRARVKEALERSGYGETQRDQYLLAWQCFKEYTDSVSRKLNQFRAEDFQNIATRYNELNETETSASGSEINTWLHNIGEAIQQLSDPPHISFWTRRSSHSDEEKNWLENVPFEISYDRQRDRTVKAFRKAIARLLTGFQKLQDKQTLFFRYALNLTQTQVSEELKQNQSSISRRLERLNRRIFQQILAQIGQHRKIQPSAPILTAIEAVLYQHYSKRIDGFVKKIICSLDDQTWELLKLYYVVQKPLSDIGAMIQRSEEEVRDRLEEIQQSLSSQITNQIQQQLDLELQPNGAAQQEIPKMIGERLETICNIIYSQREQKQSA